MSEEKSFLIVNPKGAMHVVSEGHAKARLKIVGWRLATAEEKEAYNKANGNQRFDKPLAKPFTPEALSDEEALPVSEAIATKKEPETLQDVVAPVAKKRGK